MLLEDHRRRAVAGGVDIITGARVHSAQRLGTGWELGAGQEGFQSAVVVNAAGAWADELAVLSGVEKLGLQPYRRTAAIVDVEHPLPEACPMVAAADDSFYFRPDNGQVLISPAEHVPSGPEDARPYPGDIERLIARLNAITTLGIRNVRTAWTGLRTEAADGVPVVGFDAEATGFFWLAGQGGYGFQTSSGIAELAAGLILAGQGSAPARPRLCPRRGRPVRHPGQRRRWPRPAGPSGAEEWIHEHPHHQYRRTDDPGRGTPRPPRRGGGDRGRADFLARARGRRPGRGRTPWTPVAGRSCRAGSTRTRT